MPSINNPVVLTIEIDGGSRATCRVDYTIVFDELDRALNIPFKERCQLWGADGWFTGDDDAIPNGLLRNATTRSNGQTQVTRHLSKQLNRADLDEDFGGDEVYAKVSLKADSPLFPDVVVTRKSSEVSGRF